jgi:hypothetical protein
MFALSPDLKKEDKPKKEDIYKLSTDKKEVVKKAPKIKEQDVKVFEAMQFGIKK